MPGLSGGIVMDPTRNVAYVSGLRASPHTDEKPPARVPGQQGDVIQVLSYSRQSGRARYSGLIGVPPPPMRPPYQEFPPNATAVESYPQELAISPDGKTLLAALNLADAAAVIDTKTKSVRYVDTGHYPYGAAIDRAGHGFVTSETNGTVSEIDLANATKTGDIQAGPHLSHPEGMAMDPKLPRAYVAITADDQIAVIDTGTGKVERTLSVARPQGNGSAPVRVSVTPERLLPAVRGLGRGRDRRLRPSRQGREDVRKRQAPAARLAARRARPDGGLPRRGAGRERRAHGVGDREGAGRRPQPARPQPELSERLRQQHQQLPVPALDRPRASRGSCGSPAFRSFAG